MNNSATRKKRNLIILGIAVVALILGALFDHIMDVSEKHTYPREYSEYVELYSAEYGVPEAVIYAVIKTESNFDKNAVSSAPAFGLMQLTEETYEWVSGKLGDKASAFAIYDPEVNIRYGVWYLSYLYGKFDSWDVAFAAYNAGPGHVMRWLEDSEYSSDGATLDHIPFKETRNYVEKVNKAIKKYNELYYSK